MNLVKHMEAVFILALAAAGSASYFAPANEGRSAIQDASVATETRMAVVVVKGKRPTPAERQALVLAARDDDARRG